MAAFSTFLRFLKWKMDGKWIRHPCVLLGSRGDPGTGLGYWSQARFPGLEHFPAKINGSWVYLTAPAHSGQHRCIAERSRTSVGRLEEGPAQHAHARCLTKSYSAKVHRSAFGLDTGIS
jgi:hypothetical protein